MLPWKRSDGVVTPLRGVLRDALNAAEHTGPSGVGYGAPRMPPMADADDVGAIPPPPQYDDERADETDLAKQIRWLAKVVETHDAAIDRRQRTFDATVTKMALEHETQVNKWRLKREHFAEQHEVALRRFATIAKGLGLTPDDLLATAPPSDQDQPVAE